MDVSEIVRWSTTLVLGAVAVAFELRTKHIPNWLTVGALLPVFVLAVVLDRLSDAASGFFVVAIAAICLFRRGWAAGGAVKTAALLGACAGYGAGLVVGGAAMIAWGAGELYERTRPLAVSKTFPGTPIVLGATIVGLTVHAVYVGR